MRIFLLALLLPLANASFAQTTEMRKKQFNLGEGGLAISGYDPVAYFTEKKATEGKKDITFLFNGVTYRFATARNREEFTRDPARYEPRFGGWCAFAMGKSGEKVEIDPETFKILDGRLYLFYNKFFNNTLKSWNKDEARLKNQAELNWKKFVP